MGLISIAFSAILVQNVILSRFLGICPFLGVSNKSKSSIGMGLAVVFVITLSSVVSWLIYYYLLDAFSMTYMRTIVFILVIASLVQIIEMFLKKFIPSLYKALGIYLPLITTNCAVLGVATLSIDNSYNLLETLTFAFASSVGFLLVIYIFSTLREKMNRTENSFSGIPIALITAGIMAMIFARFAGVI
ncbi:MAG: RnfABCDGE type electron transport complex subunit A [Bacilli bacterium]|jgi:electron transport complex protein RnfA|nr:RnfABCDGE type electron transport complex subunit A [Bacilli bacterium]MDD2681682.1 RnfABCDGE type electron transport complex subunit A [Bacilli bacterium]MDD3121483.1 RnfABCDGE type electron transport complex subunit A [Bacilli bacterium]MDD4063564.1 RnfABCDGE type electron transport complex subunit A [Bacilli bacterium]MDD4482022.1 RnfABCDGE type electron transport complex subunit A [Bacilli bacterium]